jgi:hypothetical protein
MYMIIVCDVQFSASWRVSKQVIVSRLHFPPKASPWGKSSEVVGTLWWSYRGMSLLRTYVPRELLSWQGCALWQAIPDSVQKRGSAIIRSGLMRLWIYSKPQFLYLCLFFLMHLGCVNTSPTFVQYNLSIFFSKKQLNLNSHSLVS